MIRLYDVTFRIGTGGRVEHHVVAHRIDDAISAAIDAENERRVEMEATVGPVTRDDIASVNERLWPVILAKEVNSGHVGTE